MPSSQRLLFIEYGVAFDLQRNDARAESEWREAVRLRPDLTDAQRALAASEMHRGDFDALTQTAQQIISSAPKAPDGYLMRALAEMNRQKYSGAEQDLTKALSLAPASAAPYVQMGNLHQLQKQYVHKRLLEQFHLPRLSLFYMP